jgi:predicted enzyme related to lactoylglutathione lyase
MPYSGVVDADAAASAVTRLGGRQLDPVVDSPFGRMTHVADPSGALFTIIQVV